MKKKSTSKSAFFNLRVLIASVLCLFGIAVALFAQGKGAKQTQQSRPLQQRAGRSRHAETGSRANDRSGPSESGSAKAALHPHRRGNRTKNRLTRYPHPNTGAPPPGAPSSPWLQKLMKGLFRPTPTMPAPLITFEGMNLTQSGCGCQPPDSEGDVGPNHYVNAVNSSIKIFDKSGNPLNGTNGTTFNSFFSALAGTPCANQNRGDPFVFYDHHG